MRTINLLDVATLRSALGCGLIAGVLWADYRYTWTFWNHVRTVAAFAAAASFTIAFCFRG
jgi:uncharacterized membrane protein